MYEASGRRERGKSEKREESKSVRARVCQCGCVLGALGAWYGMV